MAIYSVATAGSELVLGELYSRETVKRSLIPRDDWHPFANAYEREFWVSLPENFREACIARGEAALEKEWPALPATTFLDFARNGNRSRYEVLSFGRRRMLRDLVLAECMEGKGRFMDQIANGVWFICEETYWGVPAHLGLQDMGPGLPDISEPTVDLFAAETVALLAWTDYLLGSKLDVVSPLMRERIHLEAKRRVLDVLLERSDFWWMGFEVERRVNNWNPWCNSNWLTAALLLERDESRRVAASHKILRSLDYFLDAYQPDGGCDEGPGYWNRAGGSLYDCLETFGRATDNAVNVFDKPLVKEIGRYIYRAHISGNYFINFADAAARVSIPGDLVFRYGRSINDPALASFGAAAALMRYERSPDLTDNLSRTLSSLTNLDELLGTEPGQPLLRDVWLPGVQVMAARSTAGTSKGLYLAAKGGHNAESHNHNDVGNFIVYMDGRPAIIDVGVETYTRKTFSDERYEIWTMQSAYHNLPTINGVMQHEGEEYAAKDVAYKESRSSARFALDIAGAYPPEAGVDSWKRTIRLDRGKEVRINDSYKLTKPAEEISLTLMTPCEVKIDRPGRLILNEGNTGAGGFSLQVRYDESKLTPELEDIAIGDSRLKSVWGDRLTRILLRAESPPVEDTWRVSITE